MRYVPIPTSCDPTDQEQLLEEEVHQEPVVEGLLHKNSIRLALLTCVVLIALVLAIQNYTSMEQDQEAYIVENEMEDDVMADEQQPMTNSSNEEPELKADELFHFEPLTEQKIAEAAESYRTQEKTIEIVQKELDNIEEIRPKNSDASVSILPRAFEIVRSGNNEMTDLKAHTRQKSRQRFSSTSPNHHLISCIIQKSMSTVMLAIFCFLVRNKEFINSGRKILREYPDIRLCKGQNEFKSVGGMQRRLHLHDHHLDKWQFIMVTREPVDRFLSGFIDRCIRAREYALADKDGHLLPNVTLEDIHVFPQNWRCNMEAYYDRYQFIRYSSDPSGSLLEDLTPLLRSQNVSESAISYISESLRSGRTVHSTVKTAARAFLENRVRQSPYLMELIVRLFYYDFKLFNYPIPNLDVIS